MVTFDVKDFPDILRRWAEAGRPHCGCVIVVGIDHGEFGAALEALEETFKDLPDQEAWKDRASFISRARDDADAESADGRL